MKQDAKLEIEHLKQKIRLLTSEVAYFKGLSLTAQQYRNFIHECKGIHFTVQPHWLRQSNMKFPSSVIHGTPFLFVSDIHYDEVVDSNQMGGINEYNRKIAQRRIRNVFERAIRLLFDFYKDPQYDGIVIPLGGDIVTGLIHEELRRTNDDYILRTVVSCAELLINCITGILPYFKKVFVPCVVGNHGRLDKKPSAKGYVHENFDWLVYQMVAKGFHGNKKVSFLIPDTRDAVFEVYGKRYMLTHGDTFSGGNGIAGIWSPIMRGLAKKQSKMAAINQPIDVTLLGHFHQLIWGPNFVMNGTPKGYDEYASSHDFMPEPPQQALWIEHPERGTIMQTKILCD